MRPFDSKTFSPQPGITLIEASAGTGKTYSITEIVSSLIESGRCAIDQILLLTFTNAATTELKDRIRKKLQENYDLAVVSQDSHRCEKLAQAIDQFDQAVIQTIHGFCQRILHEFSIDCGLSVEFEVLKEQEEFLQSVKYSVIRRIQNEAENHPNLIPFCSWLGFGKGYIEKLLLNPSLLNQIDDLATPTREEALNKIESALISLKESWKHEGETIANLVQNPKTNPLLKKNYSDKFLQKSIRALNDWIENGIPSEDLFLILEAFSNRSLRNNLKKNKEFPEFEFCHQSDHFSDAANHLTVYILKVIKSEADSQLDLLNNKQNQLRYDDLLNRLEIAVESNDHFALQLRNRFQVGLIDEFQDTDPTQFQILKRIFLDPIENKISQTAEQRPLILIGDPKQAIYSFRGGDIFTYQKAKTLSTHRYFLSTNWRSTPAINDGVNKLLQTENKDPFVFSWLDYEPVHTTESNRNNALVKTTSVEPTDCSGIHFTDLPKKEYSTQSSICRKVVQDVIDLTSGNYSLCNTNGTRVVKVSDIAILVPKNQLGAKIRKELASAGIQAIISGGASVFASDEASHWYRILVALQNPKKNPLLKGALCSPMFGYSAADLTKLKDDAEKSSKLAMDFSHSKFLWEKGRLGEAISYLSTHYEWAINQSRSNDPERCLANSNHLLELILEAHASNSFSPQELINWLGDRMRTPNTSNESELLRLEIDTQSVCVQTLHKSKGLQYPIVLIPFQLDSSPTKELTPPFVYHREDESVSCVYTKDQLSGSIKAQKTNEILSEKLRLLYVGITRAEYACFVYVKTPTGKNDALTHWIEKTDFAQFSQELSVRKFANNSLPLNQEPQRKTLSLIEPSKPPIRPSPTTNWSFTSMTRHSEEHLLPGTDELPILNIDNSSAIESLSLAINDIFHFEKGTHAGLFFHNLIETTDFSSPSTWDSNARRALLEYGYSIDQWIEVIHQLLTNIADIQLEEGDKNSKIGLISNTQFYKETEFTFPMHFDLNRYKTFKRQFEETYDFTLPPVDSAETVIRGYMKGVIDLWLNNDGKIYLLDWKSNHLGDSITDYSPEALTSAMNAHNYHLQYLLYLCAIQRYLSLIEPDCNFNTRIGGVYYVFLRGLDLGIPHNGIFSHKPDHHLIEALNHCFVK